MGLGSYNRIPSSSALTKYFYNLIKLKYNRQNIKIQWIYNGKRAKKLRIISEMTVKSEIIIMDMARYPYLTHLTEAVL